MPVIHLTSANNIFVFESGSIPYHGTLAEIKAAGYSVEHYITKPDDKEMSISDLNESKEESGELKQIQMLEEKAIQDTSVGLTPYLFYMSVAGWMNSAVVVVSTPALSAVLNVKNVTHRLFFRSRGALDLQPT
jgi:hypothetical protein